ncbi:MAG: hypothetical protein JHD07_05940 [Bradyrhizobium sp.]|uniref:hypothetical protein n=1 Tax=Bradyrhizobium sp. TaxID=376 RepID=UPI001A2C45A5|nr:hypothetical protein [Bradyrhizobium sp.]MBJ7402852.1 hypothetical protein [Bradyrhizobium sp.]
MARQPSQISKTPLIELRATKGALEQRWLSMSSQLAPQLGFNPQQLRIDAEAQAERVWVGLQGSACERVNRNRGGAARVVPLRALQKDLFAWLGLQEVWDIEVGPRPFVFRQLGLTVHFGYLGDPIKPQAFRLEWPGIRDWTGAGLSFQTTGAGHPHWQIDILESLAERKNEDFNVEHSETVEDFGAEPRVPDLNDLLRTISIEKMHLASAARWWLPPTSDVHGQHMNMPPDLAGLTRWLTHSVQYMQQELARCVFRV